MKKNLVISYIKYSYRGLILWILILLLLNSINKFENLPFGLFCLTISLVAGFYRYNEQLEKFKKIKAKGLTEEDLRNIEFVKKWHETRQGGLWKYCIRDGAIIAGAGLSLLISILYFIFSSKHFSALFSEPGDMFSFIGYTYIAGGILGVIIFRILWLFNERRFYRLTDPLNFLFASKTKSFNSPA